MSVRAIKKTPLPKGLPNLKCPSLLFEDIYHAPGQAAAIRFFDQKSTSDFEAMREMMRGKHVRKWMDYTGAFTKEDYLDWAGTHTNAHFLLAVHDARVSTLQEFSFVRGFVYIYSEREEKFRVKRMVKQGFLMPTQNERFCLEVSFALRPTKPGMHSGSGLISSALRQSCLQVQLQLCTAKNTEVELFAFIDKENIPAQRTVEAAGFEYKGSMRYDSDSDEESSLYILNWSLLQKKIEQRFLELQ